MKPPVFSIIIATYNRPHLLARAMASVVNQTFPDFECVVVDDGGDADTSQIVRQFKDNRICLIQHKQNKGVAAAYNTGIRASRGSLISILDDDDEYYPEFLEKMHQLFRAAPFRVGFAWAGIRRVMDSAEGEVLWFEKVWPADIQAGQAAYVAATTIGNGFGLTMKRECLDVVGFYDETFRVCEDTEYLFRLARNFEFGTIPEVLVKIHHHSDGQLTHRDRDAHRLELYEKVLMRHADFISRYPEVYDIHYRRLAEMAYLLGMKNKGRKILLNLRKNSPERMISISIDFICYEWTGVDAKTLWHKSRIRNLLSRLKKYLLQKKYSWKIRQLNRYRAKYDAMTFRTLAKKADRWLHQYPEQAHFSLLPIDYWFDEFVPRPAQVMEIGGWRGDLALKMLAKHDFITCWHNYDIITDKSTQKCRDHRYEIITLKDYIWRHPVDSHYNALIATHMIEHIKWRELLLLINWIPEHIATVLFEAPIEKTAEKFDWTGDRSTHVLEKGWEQIIGEMKKRGLEAAYSKGDTLIFVRSVNKSPKDKRIDGK